MLRTLEGWVRNGVDSLALALSEPVSLVIVVGVVAWVAVARALGASSLRLHALLVGLAGWTMAILALTVYPLSFASADWVRSRQRRDRRRDLQHEGCDGRLGRDQPGDRGEAAPTWS